MSFAQFQDNAFEQKKSTVQQQSEMNGLTQENGTENPSGENQSSLGVPDPGDHEEGPGNPEEPVPINGFVPLLLVAGLSFIIYFERKNRKINI